MNNLIGITTPTLTPPQYDKKINITKNDIDLVYISSKDIGKIYKIRYVITINPKSAISPGEQITPKNINMNSLKNALEQWLKPRDRKYFLIDNLDTRHVEFIFDHKKWLKDATSGLKGEIQFSKFDRVFKLKKQPPFLILTDDARFQFEEFIIRKFKEWLENSKKEAKYFKNLFPNNFRSKIRTKLRNMFDWSYDFQWNRITAKLKTFYILALLYAINIGVKAYKNKTLADTQKNHLFSDQVKSNLKKFDKDKWEKYIKRNGFI